MTWKSQGKKNPNSIFKNTKIFEEITSQIFRNKKEEAQWTMHKRITATWYISIKLVNTSYKEKNFKSRKRKKRQYKLRQRLGWCMISLRNQYKPEDSGTMSFSNERK